MNYKTPIILLVLFLAGPFVLSYSAEITMSRTDLLFGANFEDEETKKKPKAESSGILDSLILIDMVLNTLK